MDGWEVKTHGTYYEALPHIYLILQREKKKQNKGIALFKIIMVFNLFMKKKRKILGKNIKGLISG